MGAGYLCILVDVCELCSVMQWFGLLRSCFSGLLGGSGLLVPLLSDLGGLFLPITEILSFCVIGSRVSHHHVQTWGGVLSQCIPVLSGALPVTHSHLDFPGLSALTQLKESPGFFLVPPHCTVGTCERLPRPLLHPVPHDGGVSLSKVRGLENHCLFLCGYFRGRVNMAAITPAWLKAGIFHVFCLYPLFSWSQTILFLVGASDLHAVRCVHCCTTAWTWSHGSFWLWPLLTRLSAVWSWANYLFPLPLCSFFNKTRMVTVSTYLIGLLWGLNELTKFLEQSVAPSKHLSTASLSLIFRCTVCCFAIVSAFSY